HTHTLREEEEQQQQQELGPAEAGPWSSEDEEAGGGGAAYQYLPLNQEPGPGALEQPDAGDQDIGQRLQELGLYLPQAPVDSDDDDDEEEVAAQNSRQSIPMDPDHVELVKRTMAAIQLPSLGIPTWAREISEEQWQNVVQRTIQTRQGVGADQN
ncbi:male-enhanced antigen 1, partial [Callorhinchus milii]